ncbi:MAG: copper homeostasis protein CutC [Calditrichaeota bacterium]|nr:copper homeostasis protein CutC [Calditrichota bacterium]
MKRKLEICCYTAESASVAAKAGADRIELCDNYNEGGTTPSFGTIACCLEKVQIPVNVIVRPRGGDFLYTDNEFEIVKRDVLKIKELGANGIVAGFLKANGEIDLQKTKVIVELAYPLEFTFHRAFDMCNDPLKALDDLIRIGVTRILTSGAKNKAMDGIELICDLVGRAEDKIIIMPGSGVDEKNLAEIIKKTQAFEFHSSAKTFEKSRMSFINTDIYMGGVKKIDESLKVTVDSEKVKKMAAILKS